MQSASLVALLQAALSLLTLVQSTPNIPASLQTTAVQTAQQAISLVISQLSGAPSNSQSGSTISAQPSTNMGVIPSGASSQNPNSSITGPDNSQAGATNSTSGNAITSSSVVPGSLSSSSAPSATIDANSLYQQIASPGSGPTVNVTGSAFNVDSVRVAFISPPYSGATDFSDVAIANRSGYFGGITLPQPVTGNEWAAEIIGLPVGTSSVFIYDGSTQQLLTSGLLVIHVEE